MPRHQHVHDLTDLRIRFGEFPQATWEPSPAQLREGEGNGRPRIIPKCGVDFFFLAEAFQNLLRVKVQG